MTDEVKQRQEASEWECSICGVDGGPQEGCDLCHGQERFRQTRSFTLSEERQGLNPKAKKGRYGRTGDVNPRLVVLPGGHDPSQGKGQD